MDGLSRGLVSTVVAEVLKTRMEPRPKRRKRMVGRGMRRLLMMMMR